MNMEKLDFPKDKSEGKKGRETEKKIANDCSKFLFLHQK